MRTPVAHAESLLAYLLGNHSPDAIPVFLWRIRLHQPNPLKHSGRHRVVLRGELLKRALSGTPVARTVTAQGCFVGAAQISLHLGGIHA